MDFKTITDGLTTIKELVDLITKIGEETNNLALQKAILELDKKNYILEKEILELKKELDKRNSYNMTIGDNCYWNIKEDGTKDGPYCTVCWDKENTSIRLTQNMVANKHYFTCGNCKNEFYINNYGQRG